MDEADWRALARGFAGGGVQYANPWHPNAIHSLWNGDMDAVIELHGHIRAENPGTDVRWLLDSEVQADDLTGGHVVILGAGLNPGPGLPLDFLRRRMNLPVAGATASDDPEYGGSFVVPLDEEGRPNIEGTRREQFCPRFLTTDGRRLLERGEPVLEYDVALLAAGPEPAEPERHRHHREWRLQPGHLRRSARAHRREPARHQREVPHRAPGDDEFLDAHARARLRRPDRRQTLTPDLTRPFHRLRTSA